MRILILTLILYSSLGAVYGQQITIEGRVVSGDHVVSFVSVSIKNSEGEILAYTQSDDTGHFKFILAAAHFAAAKQLEVRRLGYASATVPIEDGRPHYEVTLEEQAHLLDEVLVKRRIVDQRNDTITYDVSPFALTGDLSIGDVIRRMPGMEVSKDGQISFNGQPISHFYIDGDDLLQDRYAIGTRTIPHEMVKRLEVLKNHEHIQVLKDISFSSRVAINLSLRSDTDVHVSSEFQLGAGLPAIFDGTWNGLIFNKQLKSLNSVRANNSGTDLKKDFQEFQAARSTFASEIRANEEFLSTTEISEPWIAYNRYYDNTSGSAQINFLQNLKNNWQFRSAGVFWMDRNDLEYTHDTRYLISDTSRYSESKMIHRKPNFSMINVGLTRNNVEAFVENKTQFSYRRQHDRGELNFNAEPWEQGMDGDNYHLSSSTKYLKILSDRGRLLDLQHDLIYNVSPQILTGVNEASTYQQDYRNPMWMNRLRAKYTFPEHRIFKHGYELLVVNERQNLASELQMTRRDALLVEDQRAENSLAWRKNRVALQPELAIHISRLRTVLQLPLVYQHLRYYDPLYSLDQRTSEFFLEPSLSSRYKVKNDELWLKYRYQRLFGGINGVYRGVVMHNLNHFSSNLAEVPMGESLSGELSYHLSRPIYFLFAKLALSHNFSFSSTLTSQRLDEDYIQNVQIYAPHSNQRMGLAADISKYFPSIKSTIKIKPSYAYSTLKAIFNDANYESQLNEYILGSEIEFSAFKNLRLTWLSNQRFSSSSSRTDILFQSDSQFSLRYPVMSTLFLRSDLHHVYFSRNGLQKQQYTFVDLLARYSIPQTKINLEMSVVNVGNVNLFRQIYEDSFQISESTYRLRGRMVLARLMFNLF